MTSLGDRTAPVLSTELETMTFPDGAALRRWVRSRTRRHLHGVWALVGDVYSVLLTLIVVVTILAPYLRRMLVAQPGSVGAGALGGFAAVGLDPGWWLLALLMLLGVEHPQLQVVLHQFGLLAETRGGQVGRAGG